MAPHSSYGTHNSSRRVLPDAANIAISGASGTRIWKTSPVFRQLGVSPYPSSRANHNLLLRKLMHNIAEGLDEGRLVAELLVVNNRCSRSSSSRRRGQQLGRRLRDAQIQGAQNTRRGRDVLPARAQETTRHGAPAPRAAHEFLQHAGLREFPLATQSPSEQLKKLTHPHSPVSLLLVQTLLPTIQQAKPSKAILHLQQQHYSNAIIKPMMIAERSLLVCGGACTTNRVIA